MRSQIMSRAMFVLGVVGLVCSASPAMAGGLPTVPTVPELGGASLPMGMGLLTAGVLMLRARWRSK